MVRFPKLLLSLLGLVIVSVVVPAITAADWCPTPSPEIDYLKSIDAVYPYAPTIELIDDYYDHPDSHDYRMIVDYIPFEASSVGTVPASLSEVKNRFR